MSWKLYLTEYDIYNESDIIWQGSLTSFPDIATLSQIIPIDITENQLVCLVAQVLRNSSLSSSQLLNIFSSLSCCYYREKTTINNQEINLINTKILKDLSTNTKKFVCGRVFRKGDLIWNCSTCGNDNTCVQCDQCFRKSNHEGHDVYFHQASGNSGCCDCGDVEAWAIAGNCCDHSHPIVSCSEDDIDGSKELLKLIPIELQNGLRIVISTIYILSCNYSCYFARSYIHPDDNFFVNLIKDNNLNETEEVIVQLFNDDVHTYDEITKSLRHEKHSDHDSNLLTSLVDKEGSAVVMKVTLKEYIRIVNFYELTKYSKIPLLVSVSTSKFVSIEDNLNTGMKWLVYLGIMSEGLRRIVSQQILKFTSNSSSSNFLPSTISCLDNNSNNLSNNSNNNSNSEDEDNEPIILNLSLYNEKPYRYLNYNELFTRSVDFPLKINQLNFINNINFEFSSTYLDLTNDEIYKKLLEQFHIEGNDNIEKNVKNLIEYYKNNSNKLNKDIKNRLLYPLDYCQINPLSLITLASPFVPLKFRNNFYNLTIKFQHDRIYKENYSQIFTTLYPTLFLLFSHYIGVENDTLFRTTVQIYTAQSIVTLMSSLYSNQRPLPDLGAPILNTNILTTSLYITLISLGCEKTKLKTIYSNDSKLPDSRSRFELLNKYDFLSHHTIERRKLSTLLRDIEYLTINSPFCCGLINNDINPGFLNSWLDLLSLLHYIHPSVRLVEYHIERENDKWQHSTNLTIYITSISYHLLAHAFFITGNNNNGFSQHDLTTKYSLSQEKIVKFSTQDYRESALTNIIYNILYYINQWTKENEEDLEFEDFTVVTKKFFHSNHNFISLNNIHFPDEEILIPKFCVSYHPISIHIHLHRFLSCSFIFSYFGNLNFKNIIKRLKKASLREKFLLVDHPLRVLALAAQDDGKLWVRNGLEIANLIYNYNLYDLKTKMKDLDMNLLQTSFLFINHDILLQFILYRFELFSLLSVASHTHELLNLPSTPGTSSSPFAPSPSPSPFSSIPPPIFGRPGLFNNFRTTQNAPIFSPESLQISSSKYTYKDPRSTISPESYAGLFNYFVVFIIHVLTTLPAPYATKDDKPKNDIIKEFVKRDLFHRILSGITNRNQLSKVKSNIGSGRSVSDQLLQDCLTEICENANSSTSSSPSSSAAISPNENTQNTSSSSNLILKESAYVYYNPLYFNLNISQQNAALERVKVFYSKCVNNNTLFKSIQKIMVPKSKKTDKNNPYLPLFSPTTIFTPHESLKSIRELLLNPFLWRILKVGIITHEEASKKSTTTKDTNVHVLHMTFLIYLFHLILYFFINEYSVSELNEENSENISLEENEDDTEDIKKIKNKFKIINLLAIDSDCFELFHYLVKLWSNNSITENYYSQSISFLIYEFSYYFNTIAEFLEVTYKYSNKNLNNTATSKINSLKNKGKLMQEKMLEKYKAKAQLSLKKFKEAEGEGNGDEDEEEKEFDEEKAMKENVNSAYKLFKKIPDLNNKIFATKIYNQNVEDIEAEKDENVYCYDSYLKISTINYQHMSNCIICKQKKEESLSYLGYIQPSTVLKNIIMKDVPQDFKSVYRVVHKKGVNVYHSNKNPILIGRINYNEHVKIQFKEGNWVKLACPYDGYWCQLYKTKKKMKRFPQVSMEYNCTKLYTNLRIFLVPIKYNFFNKNGSDRGFVSTCSHPIHPSCWDVLYASTVSRSNSNQAESFALESHEVFCPFCKTISNTILPAPFIGGDEEQEKISQKRLFSSIFDNESLTTITKSSPLSSDLLLLSSSLNNLNDITLYLKHLSTNISSNSNIHFKNEERFYNDIFVLIKEYGSLNFVFESFLNNIGHNKTFFYSQISLVTVAHTLAYSSYSSILDFYQNNSIVYDENEDFDDLDDEEDDFIDITIENEDYSKIKLKKLLKNWKLSSNSSIVFTELIQLLKNMSIYITSKPLDFDEVFRKPLLNLMYDSVDQVKVVDVSTLSSIYPDLSEEELKEKIRITSSINILKTLPVYQSYSFHFPDFNHVKAILTSKLSEEKEDQDKIDEDQLKMQRNWSLFTSPLLSLDLTTVLSSLIVAFPTISQFKSFLSTIILAKVCQVLMDPISLGYFPFISKININTSYCSEVNDNKDIISFGNSLLEIQSFICSTNNTERKVILQPIELAELVLDSLLPFFEFLIRIYEQLDTNFFIYYILKKRQDFFTTKSLSLLKTYLDSILNELFLPTFNEIFAHNTSKELIKMWLDSLQAHYPPPNPLFKSDVVVNNPTSISAFSSNIPCSPFIPSPDHPHTSEINNSINKNIINATIKKNLKKNKIDESSTKRQRKKSHGNLSDDDENENDDVSKFLDSLSNYSNFHASTSLNNFDLYEDNSQDLIESDEMNIEDYHNTIEHESDSIINEQDYADIESENLPNNDEEIEHEDVGQEQEEQGHEHEEHEQEEHDEDHNMDQSDEREFADESDEEGQQTLAFADNIAQFQAMIETLLRDRPNDVNNPAITDFLANLMPNLARPRTRRRTESRVDTEDMSDDEAQSDVYESEDEVLYNNNSFSMALKTNYNNFVYNWFGIPPRNPGFDRLAPKEFSLEHALKLNRVPLQSSISGNLPIISLHNHELHYNYPDFSHFNIKFSQLIQENKLIDLKYNFTDLYYDVRFPENNVILDEPCICLICGQYLNGGQKVSVGDSTFDRTEISNYGECTMHTVECGGSTGIFYLLQNAKVLLIRNTQSVYFKSIYLDKTGEILEYQHQMPPLFLSTNAYRNVEKLYLSHCLRKEVSRIRASSDSYVRRAWF